MGPEFEALLPLMSELEQRYKLPPGILQKIAGAETGHIKDWNTRVNATSPKGARGLMQFMPATAGQYSVDPLNPESAIKGAARYLADAKAILGTEDPRILAAAYNAGTNHPSLKQGQVPNIPETIKYVDKVAGGSDYTPPSQGLLAQMGSTPILSQQQQPAWNPEIGGPEAGTPAPGQRPMPEAPKTPANMTDEEFAKYKDRYQQMQQMYAAGDTTAARAGLGALGGVEGWKDVSDGARDGFKRVQGLLAMIMGRGA